MAIPVERASSSAHPHRNNTTEHTTGLPDTSSAISFHVGGCDHRVSDCSSMLSATAAGLARVDPRRRSRSTVWWSHRVEPRVYSDADARSTPHHLHFSEWTMRVPEALA